MDDVALEAPLEVRFAGRPATVLMRTPGHDEELVRGFLFSEGIIARADDVLSMRRPDDLSATLAGNVIDVRFAATRRHPGLDRSFVSSASCGVCGKRSIESLEIRAARLESAIKVRRDVLTSLPGRLKARSADVLANRRRPCVRPLHARRRVGGGARRRGTPQRSRQADRLGARENLIPLDGYVLLLSGRVSYELVQKAVMASIPIVAAVGAPSSLAIDMAKRFNLTLVGFLRPEGMNSYVNSFRINNNF